MYLCLDSNNSLLTNGSGNVIRSKEKSDLNHIYPFIYTRKDMFFSASLKLQTKRYERPLVSELFLLYFLFSLLIYCCNRYNVSICLLYIVLNFSALLSVPRLSALVFIFKKLYNMFLLIWPSLDFTDYPIILTKITVTLLWHLEYDMNACLNQLFYRSEFISTFSLCFRNLQPWMKS